MVDYTYKLDLDEPVEMGSRFRDQRQGIGVKPKKEEKPEADDWSDMFYGLLKGYFGDEDEAKKALTTEPEKPSYDMDEALETLKSVNLPSRITEPVIEGAPEKPEMGSREPFELEVDTIGNEALDRSGMRLVDVTDTEEGKLTNEEPLYEMAEEIDPGTIDTEPLDADGVQPTNGKGLMSQTHREVTLEEVPSNIDTVFLGQQEGSAKTKAYIPKKDGKVLDKSGVTIGTGVDLGSKDKAYFRYLKDPDLVAKLEPYFGKKKDAAVTALKDNPLTLSKDEVAKLDAYVKKLEFRTLKNRWNTDSSVKWEELPSGKATAVASVYYQYGPAVFNHNFWTQTTGGQWQQAYDNLMNYGDKYSSRRKREAAILKKAL